MILFSPCNTAAELSTVDDKGLYFRTAPPDNLQAAALTDVIMRDGVRRIVIVARDDAYGRGLMEAVRDNLRRAGIEDADIRMMPYSPDEPDFSQPRRGDQDVRPQWRAAHRLRRDGQGDRRDDQGWPEVADGLTRLRVRLPRNVLGQHLAAWRRTSGRRVGGYWPYGGAGQCGAGGEAGHAAIERETMSETENETAHTRGDERIELIVADTNNDGKADLWVVDTDGDGKADLFQFDHTGDGQVDLTIVDRTQDGNPDEVIKGDGGLPPTE